nr:DUF982 domain-containing protein [Rhizobium sp. ARZ01]
MPVCVAVTQREFYLVRGPKHAFDLLVKFWPSNMDESGRRARQACIDALCCREPASLAREQFLKACREADLLVRYDLEGMC